MKNGNEVLPAEGLVKIDVVLSVLSISRTTLYKIVKDGSFPAPKKLGAISLWKVQEIREYIKNL